jgi:hypothetical protein
MSNRAKSGQEYAASARAAPGLLNLSEPLASISVFHLTPATRDSLRRNTLSVNAYPTAHGGLVYIGASCHRTPVEPDLSRVVATARHAGLHWLLFDEESPVVRDLPVYDAATPMASVSNPSVSSHQHADIRHPLGKTTDAAAGI